MQTLVNVEEGIMVSLEVLQMTLDAIPGPLAERASEILRSYVVLEEQCHVVREQLFEALDRLVKEGGDCHDIGAKDPALMQD